MAIVAGMAYAGGTPAGMDPVCGHWNAALPVGQVVRYDGQDDRNSWNHSLEIYTSGGAAIGARFYDCSSVKYYVSPHFGASFYTVEKWSGDGGVTSGNPNHDTCIYDYRHRQHRFTDSAGNYTYRCGTTQPHNGSEAYPGATCSNPNNSTL